MSDAFRRSTQLLSADSAAPIRIAAAVAAVLLAGWLSWCFFATIPVFVVSDRARLEAGTAVHVVEAPVTAEVRSVHARLGQGIRAGDILVKLDTERERLRQREDELRATSKQSLVVQLQRQIALEQEVLAQTRIGSDASHREALQRFHEADEQARGAETEARRAAQLYGAGLLSEAERQRLESQAARYRAAADSLSQVVRRSSSEVSLANASRLTTMEKLKADLAVAEAEMNAFALSAQRSAREVTLRVIRAPISGTIGEIPDLRPGALVNAGDRLASIVPSGRLTIVAGFAPAVAIGRIRPGQRSRLRLDGFAPIEYGVVTARVERVATEPQDGVIRVELSVLRAPQRIPLQHGLPGAVEVETERVTPATLFLRAVGKRIEG